MGKKYLLLGLCAFCILGMLTLWQSSPGYMDAEYYYMGAARLYKGYGFTEEIIWNFLYLPASLPQPSHTYWMPLTSLLAYLGMLIGGGESFERARWIFILMAACIPLATMKLSASISDDKAKAVMAGIMALFPFLYYPYLTTTDSFGVTMFLGGIYFVLFPSAPVLIMEKKDFMRFFAIGIVAGLMHLARVEGFIWLVVAFLGIGVVLNKAKCRDRLASLFLLGLGYLLVMGPWFWRNLEAIGALASPASLRTLWVLDYDELYIYPSEQLTFQRYAQAGIRYLAAMRLRAAWQNLQTLLFIQGQIVLLPCMIMGCWRYRRETRLRVGMFAWIFTFILMTLIFPAQGSRGGYFHASAAFQPLLWGVAPYGFEQFIQWGVRKRSWNLARSKLIFGLAMLAILFSLTCFAVGHRVLGSPPDDLWNRNQRVYSSIEQLIVEKGAQPHDIVMVNDAPGYYIFSHRKAISIPFGDYATMIEVMRRFQVRFLVLEFDQVPGMKLFSSPADTAELRYIASTAEARIYMLCRDEECHE